MALAPRTPDRSPAVPHSEALGHEPGAWVRLHESPFEGEWVGLTSDYASRLPCDRLSIKWERIWICLQSPAESSLAYKLWDALNRELVDQVEEDTF